MKNWVLLLILILIAIIIFFGFGYYGHLEVQKLGAECDLGFSKFCYKWTETVMLK